MSDVVDTHAERFPPEIRRAIEGLSGKPEKAIIVVLTNQGGLAFSELRDELDIHQQTLTDALDSLRRGGLVRNQAITDEDSNLASEYVVSEFGERFVEALFTSLGDASLPKNVVGPGSGEETYVEARNVLGGRDHALVELPDISDDRSSTSAEVDSEFDSSNR